MRGVEVKLYAQVVSLILLPLYKIARGEKAPEPVECAIRPCPERGCASTLLPSPPHALPVIQKLVAMKQSRRGAVKQTSQ
jgi:hypothetical protein